MNAFFKKLGWMLVLFYALLWALQTYIDFRLRDTYDGVYTDWNLLFQGKINSPMVFLGNSRAEAHFDPDLITTKTGIASYNLGFAGATLAIEQMRWKSYLAHNKPPKIVVQNIDLYALSEKKIPNKAQFLPYYSEPEVIHKLQELDATTKLEKFIPLSKYRGFQSEIWKSLCWNAGSNYRGKKRKGYLIHQASWNSDFDNFKKTLHGKSVVYSPDAFQKGLHELDQIIADCQAIHAKLILVWTPSYAELNALEEPSFSQMKEVIQKKVAQNQDVVFWDFSKQSFNDNKAYFYNSFHMNAKGVQVFDTQFSDSLNVYLKKITP